MADDKTHGRRTDRGRQKLSLPFSDSDEDTACIYYVMIHCLSIEVLTTSISYSPSSTYTSGNSGILSSHRHEMPQQVLGPQQTEPHIGGSGPLLEYWGVEVGVRRRTVVQQGYRDLVRKNMLLTRRKCLKELHELAATELWPQESLFPVVVPQLFVRWPFVHEVPSSLLNCSCFSRREALSKQNY